MPRLKLASWNVNSLKVRLPQVLDWLRAAEVDAVVLQETKLTDDAFPSAELEAAGFSCTFTGQKTYNGVALLARRDRLAIGRTILNLPGYPDPQKRFVAAELTPAEGGDAFWFAGGYFPNGAEVGSRKYLYKLDWMSAATRVLRELLDANPRLILGGDFNVAPEDRDCWDPAAWAGHTLVSAPERAALLRLQRLCGLTDSFRMFAQPPESYSWWDYRQAGFEKNRGLRIDLLLASEALKEQVTGASIDTAPRANPQPSDHAPVLVTLEV